jgi:hypothetical protein
MTSARVASAFRMVWSISAAIAGIDLRELFAGRYPRRSNGNNFARILRAGLRAALRAARAYLIGKIQPFGFGGWTLRGIPGTGRDARQNLLTDLCHQAIQFRLCHDNPFFEYRCSMSMIFCTRA